MDQIGLFNAVLQHEILFQQIFEDFTTLQFDLSLVNEIIRTQKSSMKRKLVFPSQTVAKKQQ